MDYIIGGCEISLIVAIDFTGSNGYESQFLFKLTPTAVDQTYQTRCTIITHTNQTSTCNLYKVLVQSWPIMTLIVISQFMGLVPNFHQQEQFLTASH